MKKIIQYLIIANLILVFIHLINRLSVFHEFLEVFVWVILTPILFGVFLYYLARPLNNRFIKKNMSKKYAAMLTLLFSLFVVIGVFSFFGQYIFSQIIQFKILIADLIYNNQIDYLNNIDFGLIDFSSALQYLFDKGIYILKPILVNVCNIFNKGMIVFSDILLIVLIFFFLLRDGDKFKAKVLKYCPNKYKDIVCEILGDGDKVLATYIIGQAKVATSLAIMVYIGYRIIGIPSGGLLASITFVLAFIPFVGFFISMLVPYIIAFTMGYYMVVKLSLLFIIAQTLKGRVVVPFIMGRTMKIHPLTDIFLVVGGAAIGGPLVAFCIVPIYSLLKLIISKLYKQGYLSIVDKIKKV